MAELKLGTHTGPDTWLPNPVPTLLCYHTYEHIAHIFMATTTPLVPVTSDACDVFHADAGRVADVRAAMPEPLTVERLAETFKALGDPTRVRMLSALSRAELCVCDLATLLGATGVGHLASAPPASQPARRPRAARRPHGVLSPRRRPHRAAAGAGPRARRGNRRRPPGIADVTTVRERAACTVCEVHAESTFRSGGDGLPRGGRAHRETAEAPERPRGLLGRRHRGPPARSMTRHGSRRASSPQRSPTPACVRGSSTRSPISPQPARLASCS